MTTTSAAYRSDAIGMRVGIEKTAMIWPSLAEAMDEDHSGLPMGEVIP